MNNPTLEHGEYVSTDPQSYTRKLCLACFRLLVEEVNGAFCEQETFSIVSVENCETETS